ncbi:MAG TPA: hypothetical protein PLZ84_05810 [Clostridia bacterium]|nr:hypothetical protein [Clostridia bacterium]
MNKKVYIYTLIIAACVIISMLFSSCGKIDTGSKTGANRLNRAKNYSSIVRLIKRNSPYTLWNENEGFEYQIEYGYRASPVEGFTKLFQIPNEGLRLTHTLITENTIYLFGSDDVSAYSFDGKEIASLSRIFY